MVASKVVSKVESHNYLDIFFDYNMKWDKHIETLIKRTKYLIFVFAKLRKIMETKTLLMLCHAFFHSVISYEIIAWGGAYKNDLNLLQGQHSRIIRIINKKDSLVTNPPPNIHNLFTAESLSHHYKTLRIMYENVERNTRFKNLQIPKLNRAICEKNSDIVAIKTFHMLPNNLKTLVYNKKTIKDKLKNFIMK